MSFILLGILNSQAAAGGVGAYDLLETTQLTTTTASVSFTGLGAYSDYKHLQLRGENRVAGGNKGWTTALTFNSDTGANYSYHRLGGNGSNTFTTTFAGQSRIATDYPAAINSLANSFQPFIIDILDFQNASKYTTTRSLAGKADDPGIILSSGNWRNVSAVTSITLEPTSGESWASLSRWSLYGIKG